MARRHSEGVADAASTVSTDIYGRQGPRFFGQIGKRPHCRTAEGYGWVGQKPRHHDLPQTGNAGNPLEAGLCLVVVTAVCGSDPCQQAGGDGRVRNHTGARLVTAEHALVHGGRVKDSHGGTVCVGVGGRQDVSPTCRAVARATFRTPGSSG